MQNGWIATKLAHDGPQYRPHRGCAEGQSQRSRDTGTSLMSRNVCYTVPSDVLSLHALTLRSTITLSFWCKCQAARCNVTPAFSLRKFFKESLTHGPLNLCVNEKTVRVNDSPYFQSVARPRVGLGGFEPTHFLPGSLLRFVQIR